MTTELTLDYEKLDVYQVSLQFLALTAQIIAQFPAGYSAFADQLRRASLSIALNIAEGVGRTQMADRRRFYTTARGSAMECGAILDAFRILSLASQGDLDRGKTFVVRIVSMLTKMCR